MLLNPDPTTTAPPPPTPTILCSNCGIQERRFLIHNVRHRGVFRRLCTTCVLRLHPNSFCPTCFLIYPPHPPNDAVIPCSKCYSSSHTQCVVVTSSSPYVCPLCVNPSTPIFKLRDAVDGNEDCRVMNREMATKLLAAAKISSASMIKAAAAARAEAERRAKEAAFTRKRAKEALEHVARLKEKAKKKEEEGGNSKVIVSRNNGNPGIEEKIDIVGNVLNAVELRENEKIMGGGVAAEEEDGLGLSVDDFGALIEVEEIDNDDSGSDLVIFTDMENGAENLDDANNVVDVDQIMYQENGDDDAKQHANGGSQ